MSALTEFLITAISFSVLFLLPGLATSEILFSRDDLDIFQRVPIGFSFILGIFLSVFLITTTLALDWQAVQWIWAVLALSLLVAGATRWRSRQSRNVKNRDAKGRKAAIAIVVFVTLLALAAGLTLFTPRDEDDWSYYQIVRTFVDATRFTPISAANLRAGLSVWWFLHAFLIRTFDLDIVRLGQDNLPLLLVPISFMAFYAFADTLFQSKTKAVAASVLQLGFFIPDLFYNDPNVQLTGGWVLGRIDQDHTAAQFIFLPVYLTLVYRYVDTGKIRWLVASFIAMVTLSAVHPQGFVHASILIAAFLVIHLCWSRERETLKRVGMLLVPYTAAFLLLLPFILFWSKFIQTAYFDLSGLVPADQSVFPFTFRWITFLTPKEFVLRPDLLLQPLLLSALLLTPWLVPKMRSSLSARFLLASMLVLGVILFTPQPFALLSRWLGWPIYRIWYLFPSVLVIVYFAPQLLHWVADGMAQLRRRVWDRRVSAGFLCLAGVALITSRFPDYVRGAPTELGFQQRLPSDSRELYSALSHLSSASGVVLAPRSISDPIPSYRSSLIPVLFRYATYQERIDDANVFYSSPVVTLDMLEILAKYNAAFLVAPADRESISQFDLSQGYFAALYRNQRYALYRVNQPLEENPLVRANTLYVAGDLQGAIDQYNLALSQNLNTSLAHTGLGMVLQVLDKPRLAIQELEQAVRIDPHNVQAHYHLAVIYRKLGMDQQADIHATAAEPLKEQPQ